jgi:hypothetical protein
MLQQKRQTEEVRPWHITTEDACQVTTQHCVHVFFEHGRGAFCYGSGLFGTLCYVESGVVKTAIYTWLVKMINGIAEWHNLRWTDSDEAAHWRE